MNKHEPHFYLDASDIVKPYTSNEFTLSEGYTCEKIENNVIYIKPVWISVNDKLPFSDETVLVYNPKDGISTGDFDKNEFSSYIDDDGKVSISNSGWQMDYDWAPYMSPTHWMPLPKPPEEKLDE